MGSRFEVVEERRVKYFGKVRKLEEGHAIQISDTTGSVEDTLGQDGRGPETHFSL